MKFARGFCNWLLRFSLVSAAISASIMAVAGSPETIKKSIDDSQLYDHVVESVFTQAQKDLERGAQPEGEEPPGEAVPVIKQAAEAAFTPDFLKNSTEQVIDSVYKWLNGEVELPDFQLDLTQQKAQFIAAAGGAAEQHVASLPPCTIEQLKSVDPNSDVLSLSCRPPNLNPAQAREQAVNELNNGEFLKNPVLSADSLPRNEKGQTVFDQAKGAQDAFAIFKSLRWIFLILSVVLTPVVLFLYETRRQGFKSLGITFLSTGGFLLLSTWLLSFILDRVARPGGALERQVNSELQEALLSAFRSLNNSFGKTLLIYCIAYIAIGAGVLLVLRLTRAKKPEESTATKDDIQSDKQIATASEKEEKTA